jgi:hypothetical protein
MVILRHVHDTWSAISMKRRLCCYNIRRLLQLHPSRSSDLGIVTRCWDRVKGARTGL